jgi:hypothetical protein
VDRQGCGARAKARAIAVATRFGLECSRLCAIKP